MALIREHFSKFASRLAYMTRISSDIMTHKLSAYPNAKSIRQKKRVYVRAKQMAMKSEVEKLTEVGFIRKVMYA